MNIGLLIHAAELIEAQAKIISDSYSVDDDFSWSGHLDAKADFDDCISTANGLRTLAALSTIEPKEKRHARKSF